MLKNVRGFLIDLEGTVYRGNVAIDGAAQALAKLKDLGFGYRFVTNTTTLRRSSIQKKLVQLGIPAHANEVFSAPYAAAQWLSMKPGAKCWILTQGDAISEFDGFNLSLDEPDYIVLGDLRNDFSFDLLNRVFRALISGGELIALQKNRFWLLDDQALLDVGAFVAALEYATGKTALVMGKPSADFFRLALKDLGLNSNQVAMVGDDLEADILGAQAEGMKAILVKTGKSAVATGGCNGVVQPDLTLESLGDMLDESFSALLS